MEPNNMIISPNNTNINSDNRASAKVTKFITTAGISSVLMVTILFGDKKIEVPTHNNSPIHNNISSASKEKGIPYIDLNKAVSLNMINNSNENLLLKEKNLEKLNQIEALEDNWNGYDASAFKSSLIQQAKNIINHFAKQPEIFPTACDSIQFEFEKENGDYLEFELSEANQLKVFKIEGEKETEEYIKVQIEQINEVVNKFYG